jgi:nucleoside-diphosphate-sugar epimerase
VAARALIAGCGYAGLRLARRLVADGVEVVGTVRQPSRAADLEAVGVQPLILEVDHEGPAPALEELAPDVCFCLIPPASLDADPRAGRVGRIVESLRRAPLECFIYASSTGVYGDRGGALVDETTVPKPDSPKGEARLVSERRVLELGWKLDARPRIGRIGGIYGPDRTLGPAIREGRYQLIRNRDSWTSRIHVDDLARGLEAIWKAGANGRVYNLCDDEPHLSSEYARFTAQLLGLDLLEIGEDIARDLYDPDRLARKLGSRRVSNRRMREELGVELAYPTFREGVPAALKEEGSLA